MWNKIEDLSKKGILPPELGNASILTKNYGNVGAHGGDVNIPPYEIETINNFVRYIIEYLYIMPAKIDEAQKTLDKNKN